MKKVLPLLLVFFLAGCGGGDYQKNPVDTIIQSIPSDKPFTLLLNDMDVNGTFFKSYYHKYKILVDSADVPVEKTTGWLEVKKDFFFLHENDLGMEIAARNAEGKLSKNVAPPGYSNYIGNSRYGEWRSDNSGNSFWVFYGKFAMMNAMFNMFTRPVYRRDYDPWYGGGYYGSRGYYGPKDKAGSYKYGTNSSHTKSTRKDFFTRKASKSGWSKSSSRSRSSGRWRSSGGGFGK